MEEELILSTEIWSIYSQGAGPEGTLSSILMLILLALYLFTQLYTLTLNFEKSKIMAFGKVWKPLKWSIRGKRIEQIKSFKYLGIYHHYRVIES